MGTLTDYPVETAVLSSWPAEGLESVPVCPCCGSGSRTLELDGLEDRIFGCAPGRWNLFKCESCRSVYLDPRPDRQTIALAYRRYYTHRAERERSKSLLPLWLRDGLANSYRNRVFGTDLAPSVPGGWLITSMTGSRAHALRLDGRGLDCVAGTSGTLLDIGCGNGAFLGMAGGAGWDCYGIEPDAEAASVASAQGIRVIGAHVDELRGRYDSFFDLITMNHVIEHLHDPIQVLKDCCQMLKSGAFLWLETPNIGSVGYEIYLRAWRGLEPPRHLLIFNPKALVSALAAAGFESIAVLRPRDAAVYTFSRSSYIEAGSLAEVDPAPLSAADRVKLTSNIRRAKATVRRDPSRSEFINVVAYKRDVLRY